VVARSGKPPEVDAHDLALGPRSIMMSKAEILDGRIDVTPTTGLWRWLSFDEEARPLSRFVRSSGQVGRPLGTVPESDHGYAHLVREDRGQVVLPETRRAVEERWSSGSPRPARLRPRFRRLLAK